MMEMVETGNTKGCCQKCSDLDFPAKIILQSLELFAELDTYQSPVLKAQEQITFAL